jgi:type I restriction-modification system DNA methylase subunit
MTSGKLKVAKDQLHIISSLVKDLNESINEIQTQLRKLFDAFKAEKIKGKPRDDWLKLFNEWTSRSQLPTFNETLGCVKEVFESATNIEEIYDKLTRKLPFDKKAIEKFIDRVEAGRKKGEDLEKTLIENLWEVYENCISNFLQQTAHVIVGRLLLYKVGVDKEVFKQITLPSSLEEEAYLDLYHTIRKDMEKLVPGIYSLSEFDWWYIPDVYRGLLERQQELLLCNIERDLDIAIAHVIKKLDFYDFAQVDRDVWKEVYLLYLSEEERRKLGFVPTPDEIVGLILDLIGYDEDQEGLCQKEILDPACGSGTFLVEAVVRLRKHLERSMSCHTEIHAKLPEWERKRRILDIISKAVYGIDIHPFATFLTTLNLLFQLIDLYAEVKQHFPSYALKLRIVTHDALIKPSLQGSFQEEITNSRLKEALRRSEEYSEINKVEFDYVIGNPPWGGVLIGKLGPLSDPMKKREYKNSYSSATGKFDIYVLFIERGLKWLKEGGVLGMITQITYLDSDFGKGIRGYIRNNAIITHLIDLSYIGDLIFPGFTNYPAITILRKTKLSGNTKIMRVKVEKANCKNLSQKSRELSLKRRDIIKAVKEALQQLQDKEEELRLELGGFKVIASWYPLLSLLEPSVAPRMGKSLLDFVEVIQGVTWGGKGTESIFLKKEDSAEKLNLEHEIVLKCIGGENIKRWHIEWKGEHLLFPYVVDGNKWSRAFKIVRKDITEPLRLIDPLDFESYIDDKEREISQQDLPENEKIMNILEHRIALGLVKYPNAATYLAEHYQQLRRRTFEGKSLRQYNKMWYEYHRPRTPAILQKPKIVGARLMKKASFALDTHGFLLRDSAIAIIPKRGAFKNLTDSLEKALERKLSEEEVLMYILAFLNSEVFDRLLIEKISKKRGGYPIVNEELLQRFSIPIPTTAYKDIVEKLLGLVKKAVSQVDTDQLDREINNLVKRLYQDLAS